MKLSEYINKVKSGGNEKEKALLNSMFPESGTNLAIRQSVQICVNSIVVMADDTGNPLPITGTVVNCVQPIFNGTVPGRASVLWHNGEFSLSISFEDLRLLE